MGDADERDLVERCRAGDGDAVTELTDRYFSALYDFFARNLGTDGQALLPETFTYVVAASPEHAANVSLRARLFGAARQQLCRHLVRQGSGRTFDFSRITLADVGTMPLRRATHRGEDRILRQALWRLPIEQHLAVEFRCVEGLHGADLGEALGTSPEMALARVAHGLAGLHAYVTGIATEPEMHGRTLSTLAKWAAELSAPVDEHDDA